MSGYSPCTCTGTRDQRMRNWYVVDRNVNHSAFNGYRPQYSKYSTVRCRNCNMCVRSKGRYVGTLPDGEI